MLTKSTIYLLQTGNARDVRGVGKFPKDKPDPMTRYSGGQGRKTHPYISGYWYAFFKLPQKIFSGGNTTTQGLDNIEAEHWLHTTIEAFNPPSVNPTKFDVPAMGGLGASFIGGNQYNRTFSCEFREYMDTPVSSILSVWNNVVDRYYGASTFDADEYIPASYKGWAAIFICKPTTSGAALNSSQANTMGYYEDILVKDIERAFIFEGVFPETNPYDSFSSDISTNDGLRFSVTFSFDGWAIDKDRPEILTQAIEYFRANNNFTKRTRDITNGDNYLGRILDPVGNAGK